ncbi:tripartite tricarboxylate transporter substrate-binding protein [Bordetella bronchiseptica]|uniref:tripartite tricarboxylate transporter substrate-binding protein n=1 Tax=Bordetella bronchiseptica TaxID=518 RepID=UPI000444D712|nr:tripartite tricarboxylate transporter substrate-binding protein [Bordetella bronchiseptica]BAO67686.1 hypothetical protein BBS798_0960 [Bordetella bronchiseptica]
MFKLNLSRCAPMALAIVLAGGAMTARAQDHAPVRIVIGFSAGGALDNMSRAIAEQLKAELGQSVIVENKPGAGTQIALQTVKRSPPDGGTILISPAPPFVLFPLTYDRLQYDADKDLVPVAHLADTPLVASTSSNSPYSTMHEYLAWVRKNPDSVGVGMVSLGGALHFGLLKLNQHSGLNLMPIAYKGAPAMLTDEIGGVLPIGMDTVAATSELARAGKIKYLGVTGTERSALLPDVPTLGESGAPGFEQSSGWYAAFVSAGTPKAVTDKLERALIKIVKDPAFSARVAQVGLVSTGKPGAELAAMIQAQRQAWQPVVKASGFKALQ